MRKLESILWRVLCTLLFLCAVWVSRMAYHQVMAIKADRTLDRIDWLSSQQTQRLMRFHGTDALKITRDKVYIWRDSEWVPVFKRGQG
jgi:hypothetical protein